jgi:hypothetical protein
MRAAGSSVSQRRHMRPVGIECKGRDKVFSESFSYDQHKSSAHLCGTACFSLPEKTRMCMQRNAPTCPLSTATLQETAFHRSRGCESHILHILHVLHIVSIEEKNISQNGPYRGGKARFEANLSCRYFQFLIFFSYCFLGVCVYSAYFLTYLSYGKGYVHMF